MTDLRTAAQQALEALGLWATGCDMDAVALNDLIHHLQTALAEPVQAQLTAEHISSPECWCQPELNYVDPVTGAKVWVHKEVQ